MVLSFFKKGPGSVGLDHIVSRSVGMLGDARHSFDLASLALLAGGVAGVADDVRETDQRINQTEQELRSELIVHIAVRGSQDIGSVLALILLLKKIERVGDQAKNILDLAEEGVSLAAEHDIDELLAEQKVVSALFAESADLLHEPDEDAIDDFTDRAEALAAAHQEKIISYLHSDLPGREVVPRAIYFRYLKRIVANLIGIVRTGSEPVPLIDYLEQGSVDTDD